MSYLDNGTLKVGVPGECTFEWWIELKANAARVRSIGFVRPDGR